MHISPEEAAAIYARACRAWYGKRALHVVTSKLDDLRRRGDSGGINAWSRVANVLTQPGKPLAQDQVARRPS